MQDKSFAANVIGVMVLILLEKYPKSEVKKMMKTKKLEQVIDYIYKEKIYKG